MNKFQRLIALLFKPLFYRLPDPKSIDKTGIIKSDYPQAGNGWIKGWLMDTPSRNIIIVCKHAGPATTPPSNLVFALDSKGVKHVRTIVKTDNLPFKIYEGHSNLEKDYYLGSDIAICKLDEPFPKDIKSYKISRRLNNLAEKTVMFDQDGNPSIAQIRFDNDIAWIKGKKRWNNVLVAGDSGMPWFVWEDKEWKVLTHTTKGQGGEGPWYAHPFVYKDLVRRVKSLSV